MQAYRSPSRPAPVPGPAITADPAGRPAPARGLRPVDGWYLGAMRDRAERQAQAIRARSEWIEARRRQLWASMDRLRDEIGPRAPSAEGRGHGGSPEALAPFLPASPAPDHGGFPEALAPFVPASPAPDHGGSPGAVEPFVLASPAPGHGGFPEALAPFVPASPPARRSAAILQELAERVESLIGIVSGQGPGEVRDDAPRPEADAKAGAAV